MAAQPHLWLGAAGCQCSSRSHWREPAPAATSPKLLFWLSLTSAISFVLYSPLMPLTQLKDRGDAKRLKYEVRESLLLQTGDFNKGDPHHSCTPTTLGQTGPCVCQAPQSWVRKPFPRLPSAAPVPAPHTNPLPWARPGWHRQQQTTLFLTFRADA